MEMRREWDSGIAEPGERTQDYKQGRPLEKSPPVVSGLIRVGDGISRPTQFAGEPAYACLAKGRLSVRPDALLVPDSQR